jgi:DNA-binding CsgD family transcriptional regulator
VESLSDRELDVFRLVGQGLTASQIARCLHLSARTVESHREKIKAKLALKTAAELNRAAVQWTLENG